VVEELRGTLINVVEELHGEIEDEAEEFDEQHGILEDTVEEKI
jgi:hypothetical protein